MTRQSWRRRFRPKTARYRNPVPSIWTAHGLRSETDWLKQQADPGTPKSAACLPGQADTLAPQTLVVARFGCDRYRQAAAHRFLRTLSHVFERRRWRTSTISTSLTRSTASRRTTKLHPSGAMTSRPAISAAWQLKARIHAVGRPFSSKRTRPTAKCRIDGGHGTGNDPC